MISYDLNSVTFMPIHEALAAFAQGQMIIMVDDEDRENEGDLVIAADHITPAMINFMVTHARGLVCLSITEEIAERLDIPMMTRKNQSQFNTAFTVSIEAASGVTTGISAADRAHTVKVAIDPQSTASDIAMPGHIFPVKAVPGGVLVRPGHTEGSVDLARLSGLTPAAVICEIMNEDGTMARLPDLVQFAQVHQLPIVKIQDLIAYRMQSECLVTEAARCHLPIDPYGDFELRVFTSDFDPNEHVALIRGDLAADKPQLVRVHSECLTGDVFHSRRCDCGWQLESALATIAREGGVLLYMRQEGRGIGLANKIKAYALQEQGFDTVEANQQLGLPPDSRDYGIGSQILRHLGLQKIRLLTNNPGKIYKIAGFGLEIVERVPIEMPATMDNVHYLRTKREKMGHWLKIEGDLS